MDTNIKLKPELSAFVLAYIECALLASIDEDERYLDTCYDINDLSPECLVTMIEDCNDFLANNDISMMTEAQAGHDFWLTRNSHGAGFWDRGLGLVGENLTKAAKAYGECELYIGDDERLYCG